MIVNNFHATVGASRLIPKDVEYQYVEMATTFYQKALASSKEAMAFLCEQRGLSQQIIKKFGLGYCNRSLGRTLPDGDHFEGAMIRGALQRYGLLKPNGHELFRGCIVIPVRDPDGRLVDMYGRKIAKYQRRKALFHLRMSTVNPWLFNPAALQRHKQILLCSSPIEALTLLTRGIETVVSTMGLGNFNEFHINQLLDNDVRKVTVIFANTQLGNRYRKTMMDDIASAGIEASWIELPKQEDINSLHLRALKKDSANQLFSFLKKGNLN